MSGLPDYPWEHPSENYYREAELEAKWAHAVDALRAANERIAELEAERDYNRTGHDSAILRIAELTKRIAELEAEVERVAADDLRKLQLAVGQRDTLRQRSRELEAANVICRTDIAALMTSCDKLEARNTELEAERDRLKAALQALYDDCAEYITTNHLYRKDGQSALANQSMVQARAALSDPSGEDRAHPASMNLYLIERKEDKDVGYDVYVDAVVSAPDEDTARRMHPSGGSVPDEPWWELNEPHDWVASLDDVVVTLIGVADAKIDKSEVIVSRYFAG
jgi:uncharacterized small protein (DUF1192 family)